MDRKPVKAKSYANIAIIKYWGKGTKQIGPFDQFDFVDLRGICIQTSLSPLPWRLRMNFTSMRNSKIQLSKPKLGCDW